MSIVCYLEFSSLMACEKKLSRVLLVWVLMLRYRLPDAVIDNIYLYFYFDQFNEFLLKKKTI